MSNRDPSWLLARFIRSAGAYAIGFAAAFLVTGVIYYRRGQLAWHGPLEIAQLVVLNGVFALMGGAAIAAISSFFDWIGWGVEERPPYPLWVRGVALAFVIVAALYLMFRPNP